MTRCGKNFEALPILPTIMAGISVGGQETGDAPVASAFNFRRQYIALALCLYNYATNEKIQTHGGT